MPHLFGRRPDSFDARDRRFSAEHPGAAKVAIPPSVDLRHLLPPCFEQTKQDCGPSSAAAFMRVLYPDAPALSRFQIYHDVRVIEHSGDEDAGVEIRDLFKAIMFGGVAPEDLWPYDDAHFLPGPPDSVYAAAEKYTISSYSRLVAESSYLQCLAMGKPIILGFDVLESFDSEELAKTGVMPIPTDREELSGHAVLCVGYDLDFKNSKAFKASGIDATRVSDKALLIRNSWGTAWGWEGGHFWMPINYATNPSTGGDAWTGTL